MLKTLVGQASKKLSKLKFDHLEEYGTLTRMGKDAVLEHIDYLIERGCLAVDSFFFPMINITDVGRKRTKNLILQHGLPQPKERKAEPAQVFNDTEFGTVHFPSELR